MLVYLVGSEVVLAELEAGVGIEQESAFRLLRYYHPATRGVQPHNCRTPIESGIFECVSITRHYACNTNQVLTNYSAAPFTGTFTGTFGVTKPSVDLA